MPLHVAVVSGSRADFGPLRPLMHGLAADARMRLSTLVCTVGERADAEHQIVAFEEAGLPITSVIARPDHDESSDGHAGPAASMAHQSAAALAGVADALMDIAPDVVLLLGDRFEILASAFAAHLLRLPVVHLSGGDETLGSLDDAMRHAIARLAALHLPSNAEAAGRLRALGIPAERIEVVGSTALDALVAFRPLARDELAASIGADLGGDVIAVTYHPATLADEAPAATLRAILAAVRDVSPAATAVVTGSNADEGGAEIDAAAAELAAEDPRIVLVPSLGPERYWSLLHHAAAVVGNSSSALIEAPVLGVPVVDVGARQASRLRTASCRHAAAERIAIAASLTEALMLPRRPEASPYGDGHAVPRIIERLAAIDDVGGLLNPSPLAPLPWMAA